MPVVGHVLAAVDRGWWALVILRADVVDIAHVRSQRRAWSTFAAVRAYVGGGFRSGLSLNPLFMDQLVSSQLSEAERVPALYAYLVNDVRRVRASVNWDSIAYVERHPDSANARGGPLGHAWRRARESGRVELGPGDRTVTVAWTGVRDVAAEAVRRSRGGAQVEGRPTSASRIVYLCRLAPGEDLARALDTALEVAERDDASAVIALADEAADAWIHASLIPLWAPRVEVVADRAVRERITQMSVAANAVVVVRGPRADLDAATAIALAEDASLGPVAPLWVGLDGAISSAGAVAHGGRLFDLLSGHPVEDARGLPSAIEVTEIAGETYARPVGRRGSTPRTRVDLIVRAPVRRAALGRTLAADTELDPILEPLGLSVVRWTRSGPVLARRRQESALEDGTRVPCLRWAIKIAAPPGRLGASWGETHFANALATALRRLGQEVVIDAYDARSRSSAHLDDVVVALRGPEPFEPQPGALSILWIISHPDEITRKQLRGFDLVYAGSTSWAASASRRFRVPVVPLLQCTDATRFAPTGTARTEEIVFVGTARGIARPSVVEPLRAGIPVSVYGPDWRGYIPAEAIVQTGISNSDLPPLYERARVVLNDHWPAMKAAGFVSNRLYDVVAAGGRAISDDVEGIDEIFQGAVRTYGSIDELLALLCSDLDSAFPGPAELAEISADVRRHHSFDARAAELLKAVLERGVGSI
jgi:hypothetical protein